MARTLDPENDFPTKDPADTTGQTGTGLIGGAHSNGEGAISVDPNAPGDGSPGLRGPYFQPSAGGSGSDALNAIGLAGQNKAAVPGWDAGFESTLKNSVGDLISGKSQPMGPDVVAAMKRNAFAAAGGQAAQGVHAANKDALHRGIFNSGVATSNAAGARDTAAQNYSNAATDVDIKAAQENFAAKMTGITKGKEMLDQLAARIASAQALGQNTAQLQAQLALGYDKIRSAEEAQHNELNAAMERLVAGSQLGAGN